MDGMIRIAKENGDEELAAKYEEKIKVVERNREEDRAAKNKDYS